MDTEATSEFDQVPTDLKERNQWVYWLLKYRHGKAAKVPYNARTGKRASTTDSSTWSSFAEAVEAFRTHAADAEGGIGFVFSPTDDFVGIDFDDCLDGDKLAREVQEIIQRLNSYTEVSPSGKGLKVIVRGEKPGASCRTRAVPGCKQVEVYETARYFTITGLRWKHAPRVINDGTIALQWLYARYLPQVDSIAAPAEPSAELPTLTDDELMEQVIEGTDAYRAQRLMAGARSDDKSPSEDDFALACIFAKHTIDEAQIRRLMENSCLKRDKWSRQGDDYLKRTIRKAIERVTHEKRSTGPAVISIAGLPTCEAPPSAGQNLTDAGNAQRLVKLHGHELRFCSGSWFLWTGKRWERDVLDVSMEMAKHTALAIYQEAAAHPDRSERNKLADWAKTSESGSHLREMLRLAQSDPRIAALPADFDADPFLFNCENGTLDLKTGELHEHSPGNLITKLARAAYDPAAKSTVWEPFVGDCCGHNSAMISFLQRAVGYSLTGDTGEEKLFFINGPGATGKSTFIEAFRNMMGDYGMVTAFATLLTTKNDGPRNDIARFVGARFVASNEVCAGRRLDEGVLKQLTGGDMIAARFLFKEFFQYKPQFKIWLAANDLPEVSAHDSGVWRRVLLVPFVNVIAKDKQDPNLKHALLNDPAERAAILAWAVKGCLEWQRDGLGVPPQIEVATENYRRSNDPVAKFIEEMCETGEQHWVLTAHLFAAYERWALTNGEEPVARRVFTLAMTRVSGISIHHKKLDGTTKRGLLGVRLRPDAVPRDAPPGAESPF